MKTVLIYDIEADGLLNTVSRIYALGFIHVGIDNLMNWTIEELNKLEVQVHYLDEVTVPKMKGIFANIRHVDGLIGHNIINYDIPLFARIGKREGIPREIQEIGNTIYNLCYNKSIILDTLVVSRLLYPKRPSHSLQSWADEFGLEKKEILDFSKINKEDIIERVTKDVKIQVQLTKHLVSHPAFGGISNILFGERCWVI